MKSFPLLYHAHLSRNLEDLPFWLKLAEFFGDPILELGCGTGRVFIPLVQAGYRVYGLDNDPDMLAVLRHHLPAELQGEARLVQGDLTAFHLGMPFNLVLLPCNTWSTLHANQRRAALGCIRRHLAPGGVFAASLPNPALLRGLPRRAMPEVEEVFAHPLDGEPVLVSSAWVKDAHTLTVAWHYDHLLANGKHERVAAHFRHALDLLEAYLEELTSAGLDEIRVYGDFDGSPHRQDAPHLILVAGWTAPAEAF